ncbi:unnamed protein product [Moneuplotes crassus]|uniref:Uncharacterized protein n=2 Tax=Euplotes crassus TaxID=5936 RepID=A0AAD1XC29_EUPCR|nr:unnamed protein product [Moneuplotes crassus]
MSPGRSSLTQNFANNHRQDLAIIMHVKRVSRQQWDHTHLCRNSIKTINLKKDDSRLRLSVGANRTLKPIKNMGYKKGKISRDGDRQIMGGQKLSILIEMDNYKNSRRNPTRSSNKDLVQVSPDLSIQPPGRDITKSCVDNPDNGQVSDAHLKTHINTLKKLVKERDDELFDLKMALDIISSKKTKEQAQKKEDTKKSFDKTRTSLNAKRPLVLSRGKKLDGSKKNKLIIRNTPQLGKGQRGISKSIAASPQRTKKTHLKNSIVIESNSSLKSTTPANKPRKIMRESSEENLSRKGLPPTSKIFESQSISHQTEVKTIQDVAESKEIQKLSEKITELEQELAKYKEVGKPAPLPSNSSLLKNRSSPSKEPFSPAKDADNEDSLMREADEASPPKKSFIGVKPTIIPKLNYQKLITSYVSKSPVSTERNLFAKLPTYVNPSHSFGYEDFPSEQDIVKIEEIEHLRPKVRLAVMVYEENFKNLIFAPSPLLQAVKSNSNEITMKRFIAKAEELMGLSPKEAVKVGRYLFERRNKAKVLFDEDVARRTKLILKRLKEFAGKYTKIETKDFSTLKEEFFLNHDQGLKEQFLSGLDGLAKCEHVSPFDVFQLVLGSGLALSATNVVVYLCRMSNSMVKINGNAIKILARKCFSKNSSHRKASIAPNESLRLSKIYSEGTPRSKKSEYAELEKDTKQKIGDKFFKELSDYIKKNDTSILDIVKPKIFDKVLNAKEYQLIKYKHLYKIFKQIGLEITGSIKQAIKHIATPFMENTVEVYTLVSVLANYGCYELFPKSNKHINYRRMDGATIRIFNRIIAIMDREKHETIEDFLGESNITYIEVVSPSRTEKIGVVNHLKFRGILRDKAVIPYGEDLDEELQVLLCLNSNREDLLMLRKMKKILKDIKETLFFNNFGMYFRQESQVDSDFENQQEKPNKTIDKLLNESRISKDLHENNKSSSDSFDAGLLLSLEKDSKKAAEKDGDRKDNETELSNLQRSITKYLESRKIVQSKTSKKNDSNFLSIL